MYTMNARHRAVLAAVAATIALGASPRGQEPSPQPRATFRSAADVVTIQASVRDARGRVLTGLTPNDFEVRDNGEIRPLLSLRSDGQSPLSVAIIVDMSGSMGVGPKIAMTRKAYESVLSQLRANHDEVALFTFDASLHERRAFTRDVASLQGALDEFEAFGTTSLYDATAAAAKQLATRSATHKAVIVLTDGIDTSSASTSQEVSGLASSIDVPVFVVATVPSVDQRTMLEGAARPGSNSADLRDLAEWTGGQFVFASSLVETAAVATTLVNDLRHQYILAIEAARDREWRRLEVRVRRPSARVKARNGYFAG
jgi:Ca-activated chloride channel family protein